MSALGQLTLSMTSPLSLQLPTFERTSWTALRAKTRRRRALFDDLVGADEKCRGKINAERLGGLEVDHKLELGLAAKRIPCSN